MPTGAACARRGGICVATRVDVQRAFRMLPAFRNYPGPGWPNSSSRKRVQTSNPQAQALSPPPRSAY